VIRRSWSALLCGLAAAAVGVAAAGCADPYAATPAGPNVPGQEAQPPAADRPDVPRRGAASPELAARRAAVLTGSWSAATFAARHARFAAEASGPARDEARLAAARARTDAGLPAASQTRVVAIKRIGKAARRRALVLLLRERISDTDATRSRWRVVEASVVRGARGWSVRRWAPQP